MNVPLIDRLYMQVSSYCHISAVTGSQHHEHSPLHLHLYHLHLAFGRCSRWATNIQTFFIFNFITTEKLKSLRGLAEGPSSDDLVVLGFVIFLSIVQYLIIHCLAMCLIVLHSFVLYLKWFMSLCLCEAYFLFAFSLPSRFINCLAFLHFPIPFPRTLTQFVPLSWIYLFAIIKLLKFALLNKFSLLQHPPPALFHDSYHLPYHLQTVTPSPASISFCMLITIIILLTGTLEASSKIYHPDLVLQIMVNKWYL